MVFEVTLDHLKYHHPMLPPLLQDCFEVFGCSQMEKDSRSRPATQARAAFILLVRKNYHHHFSYKDMGKVMAAIVGRKKQYDHATVIHAVKMAENTMFLNDEVSLFFRDNLLLLRKKHFPYGLSTAAKQVIEPLKTPFS